MNNNMLWFWLCNIEGIGNKKIDRLLKLYHSVEVIYETDDYNSKELGFTENEIQRLKNSKNRKDIIKKYTKLEESSVYFISIEHERYPDKLRNIYDAPYGLYVKGKLPKKEDKVIAIVGARNCTDYGREVAKYFAFELSRMGFHIISGLALGIDGHAHEGVLAAKGTTYGVLGSGIDVCYPKENFNIYMNMHKFGGVISEYGLGIRPKPGFFPMRNRIISGISDGILVIEAKEKSGSLITVDYGLEQGKEIYAIPGKVTDIVSSGCNNLIKMGAKLVMSPKDISEDFSVNSVNLVLDSKKNDNLLESKEKIVYACLSLQGKHITDLLKDTKIEINELRNILIRLELDNYIKEIRPNYYVYTLKE